MWPFGSSYLTVVAQKCDQRFRALESAPQVTNEHRPFLHATATEIVSRIKKGEWTASQVLEAYIAQAKVAHDQTNCLTEVMFDVARERARTLDTEFAATGNLKGPLHGIPMSLKDQYDFTGFDSSTGFTRWTMDPAKTNADVVDTLLNAGALPFVKTNVPQTMFAFECSNPLWGCSTNPYNNKYTCGGSSGGEGAIIAMDGSALGIGTDVGGSLRIPAAYCGLYTLKPGTQRISPGGAKSPNPGFESVKSCPGPMARSVQDLELVSRAIFGVQGRKHDIAPIPFREVTLPKKLRFGYYTSDDCVKTSPACRRAVLESIEALRRQGHECIEIEIPSVLESFRIFAGLTSADAYRTILSHLGPDPMEPALRLVKITPNLPGFIRGLAAWFIEHVIGDPIFASAVRSVYPKRADEIYALNIRKDDFTRTFYKDVWEKYNIDGILAPVQAIPQLPHGGCNNFIAIAVATIYYNLIDHPVGVLPVGRVDAKKDQLTEEWWNEPGHGSKILEGGLFKGEGALYNPEEIEGMPLSVQVVGQRWEEEKVLAMMKTLDEALGADRGFGPGALSKDDEKRALN
ncbi:hypothetical protein AGABI1DRAFT_112104 [Agaricus bisporus var. burnettii JB137-S8]|uniref:amidase n=1 Tax=Agaricus bisporus var. burnettii (strain JB137-S8 / ATCC MYA-4627 / FGSC 10392) TaxID=597362 RepID=K5W4Y9_AGABU|nr:uncharacterized protein AGABI1DRAFT_112104 [Agaricus bisporus var. burnettii JB137-S8]EKM81874.1 hypothetical protein AGABI1DRAFT_112104 [Agaricus bisporus var. burnettii JB137-S8]